VPSALLKTCCIEGSGVDLLTARYVITFIVLVALLTLTMLVLRVTRR
jgi:hypothetical protein